MKVHSLGGAVQHLVRILGMALPAVPAEAVLRYTLQRACPALQAPPSLHPHLTYADAPAVMSLAPQGVHSLPLLLSTSRR